MKVTIKNNKIQVKERKYPCILQWAHNPNVIVVFKQKGETGIALRYMDEKVVFIEHNPWTHSDSEQWREFQGTITLKND